jgi:Siphovirus Gp157
MSFIASDAQATRIKILDLFARHAELLTDEDLRGDMLEAETDLHRIAEKALEQLSEANAMAAAIKAREQDLTERRHRYERQSAGFRALIADLMAVGQLPKIVLPEATLSLREGAEELVVSDVEQLPQGYYRTKKEADRTAIKVALKAGEKIPGALLVPGGNVLTIRTK